MGCEYWDLGFGNRTCIARGAVNRRGTARVRGERVVWLTSLLDRRDSTTSLEAPMGEDLFVPELVDRCSLGLQEK